MAGLWRNREETPEGKYLVKRRDGSIPEWAWFVMGQCDPAAPAGLRGYADRAEELGMDLQYIQEVRDMADEWENWLDAAGEFEVRTGNPDAPPHRKDDPETISEMRQGHSA